MHRFNYTYSFLNFPEWSRGIHGEDEWSVFGKKCYEVGALFRFSPVREIALGHYQLA